MWNLLKCSGITGQIQIETIVKCQFPGCRKKSEVREVSSCWRQDVSILTSSGNSEGLMSLGRTNLTCVDNATNDVHMYHMDQNFQTYKMAKKFSHSFAKWLRSLWQCFSWCEAKENGWMNEWQFFPAQTCTSSLYIQHTTGGGLVLTPIPSSFSCPVSHPLFAVISSPSPLTRPLKAQLSATSHIQTSRGLERSYDLLQTLRAGNW